MDTIVAGAWPARRLSNLQTPSPASFSLAWLEMPGARRRNGDLQAKFPKTSRDSCVSSASTGKCHSLRPVAPASGSASSAVPAHLPAARDALSLRNEG